MEATHRSILEFRRRGVLSLAVAFGVSVIGGLVVGLVPKFAAAVIVVLLAPFALMYIANRSSWPLAVLLPLILCSLLVPRPLLALAESGLVALALLYVGRSFTGEGARPLLGLFAVTVVVVWLLLALNPNVPSLTTALLGVRKSTLVFAGIALGAAWPRANQSKGSNLVLYLLLIVGIAATAFHLFFPTFAAALPRSAGESSGMFQGAPRMQAFFPGPFHVSMLGTFLVVTGWQKLTMTESERSLGVMCALVGMPMLLMSEVRAGILTCAAGILILTLFGRGAVGQRRWLRAGLVVACAGVLVTIAPLQVKENAAIRSLTSISTDPRATGRIATWREGAQLFLSSPVYGWGPGSAGDTLDDQFRGKVHITSHNVLIKYGVEGGIIGLLAVFLVCLAVLRKRPSPKIAGLEAPAALTLLGFGLGGSSVEALPISLALAILIGLGK